MQSKFLPKEGCEGTNTELKTMSATGASEEMRVKYRQNHLQGKGAKGADTRLETESATGAPEEI